MSSTALVGLSVPLDMRRIRTFRLERSLRFYLALECEVRLSGDGWVLVGNADTLFILERGGAVVPSSGTGPALSVGNLLHLCRSLWASSIDTSPISYPACAPGGRITVRDPDSHAVSISQAESRGSVK
ncbi:VOC family protein [Amycolatopsis sp. WAC 04182]|uniref:VOC family protein n=1 Tax=Amycolatopsis sp. WAC 04182 TaxID=2203198 RepID=UPI000F793C90|nr:VOC family protein [Amycolatopsis sp. WAC 04182]